MLDWLRKFRPPEAPLHGAPQVRRLKNYSAASGYVYQYFYEGFRPAKRAGREGTEYVFQVSFERRLPLPLTVFLSTEAVEAWQAAHGRTLTPSERYATVKLALFQAFDERTTRAQMRQDVVIRPADIDAIAATLGFVE